MDVDYQNLIDNYPRIGSIMPQSVLKAMKETDERTRHHLGDLWGDNIKYNCEKLIPKHGWLNDGYADIGRGKGVIAIGSGPSLKKNQDYLKLVSLTDGVRDFEQQDFITMAANHQIKPCLEMGIIPHFAMVADGSPDLKSQLDVGKNGKYTTLISSVTAHPDVIESWKGPVKFVMQQHPEIKQKAEKHLGFELDPQSCVTEGGNILNMSFVLGIGLFRASVWMCVGNDLSFEPAENKSEQRKNYYADGDYSTNIKSKRDEAAHRLSWAGFEFYNGPFETPRPYLNLKLMHTSPQLFIYKTWLETNASILWDNGSRFAIYNCTEGGILGVCLDKEAADPDNYSAKFDSSNWKMMDEMYRGKWRTRKLYDACEEFAKAKEKLNAGYIQPSSVSYLQ